MKKILKSKKLIILTFILLSVNIYAQNQKDNQSELSGTFKYATKKVPDSISLLIFPRNYWDTPIEYNAVVIDNKFHLKYTKITKPTTYYLRYIVNNRREGIIGEYFMEPNDKINLELFDQPTKIITYDVRKRPDSVIFSGKGSVKYNLIEEINKDAYRYKFEIAKTITKKFKSIDSLNLYLQMLYQATNQYRNRKSSLLSSAKNLDQSIVKLVNYNNANYEYEWVKKVYIIKESYNDDELAKNLIKQHFKSYFEKIKSDQIDEIDYLSPLYYQQLNHEIILSELIKSSNGIVTLKDHYDNLKENYNGIVRENLINELFNGGYGMFNLSKINIFQDSLCLDALKYMITKEGKETLSSKLKFTKGNELYNTDFLDLKDNSFSTLSLRGKVYLIDIWGRGCASCAAFHEKFEKQIWPVIKNNPNFAVLSVSADKKKEDWLTGISSGVQSSYEYINVSTGPIQINHPFFKHYNINSIPFLMIVDKNGKIFAKFDALADPKEILNLILKAINQKISSK